MDREWATKQLEEFIGQIDTLMQLDGVRHLVADRESESFRAANESEEVDNAIRELEPVAQFMTISTR